jgi:tight adherence protein B
MLNELFAALNLPPAYVFYIAIGFVVAAILFVSVLVMLKYKSQRDHINRRILPLEQEVTVQNAVYLLQKENGIPNQFGFDLSVAWLDLLLIQADRKISSGRFMFLMGAITVIAMVSAMVFEFSVFVGGPLALFAGLVMPLWVLKYLKARRIKKFAFQFTEAIELIVRSLKAGHPVPTAIKMVSREMADPIAHEFGLIADEVSYGSDLVSAIQAMQKRVDYDDLPLFVTAISIQSITGGNLGSILEGLATVLRGRVKLRRKVKAAAAEGRASALILNSVPIAVMGFISIFTPHYYGDIIHETFIITGLSMAFGWMMIGNFAMYKMMNFKV